MNDSATATPIISAKAVAANVRTLGLLVLAVGIAVLTGWALDNHALEGLLPGPSTMKPITAANFMLSAIALLTSARKNGIAQDRLGAACAMIVTLWSGLTLLEYATGLDFRIDRTLLPDHLNEPGAIPGRMSIIASSGFVLFGICRLVASHWGRTAQTIFVAASLLGLFLSFLTIIGYAYDVPLLYHPLPGTSIAFNTAITFAVLFSGAVAIRPDLGLAARILSSGAGGGFVRRTLPAVVFCVPAFGWLRLQSELAGFYDERAGLAIFATVNVMFLTTVILVSGSTADRLDAQRLKHKMRQQSALAVLTNLVLTSNDFRAIRERIVLAACDVFGVEFCGLHDPNPVAGQPDIIVLAARGSAATIPQNQRDSHVLSILDAALVANAPRDFSDLDSATRLKLIEYLQAPGAQSGLIMPIQIDGKPRGHLTVLSASTRTFSADDVEFLQNLRDFLAVIRDRQTQLDKLKLRETALENAGQGVTITDEAAQVPFPVYANPAFARMTGYSLNEIIGQPGRRYLAPDADPGVIEKSSLAREKRQPFDIEILAQKKDGTKFLNHVRGMPVVSQGGTLLYYVSIHEDITDRRLREEQLREAQKLQTVGQLTGGVAHEFNNLLAVIKSNAEDMRDDLKESHILYDQADLILQAADRGAGLVRQLLAFSRKQEIQPIVTDLNMFLVSFTALLRKTLEANITINLYTAAEIPPVKIDPGQMETALLNIALNCRDAMPTGGHVTIETKLALIDADYADQNPGVTAGTYVLLIIKDTGKGMPKEVMERAFEPFFTTKEVGAGTGLGLSMVHGFVQQSGGHIRLHSEPSLGTTVYIYLPPAEGEAGIRFKNTNAMVTPVAAGHKILLVEDDDLVRTSIEQKLTRLGYDVATAPTGLEALATLEREPSFDLVFTDVIMPGSLSGADLAREIQRRWPAIKILMSSGYTEAAVLGKVKIPDGIRLLPKPYANADLERALQESLGSKPGLS